MSVSSLSMSSALSMTSFICSMNVSRSACRMKSCSTCNRQAVLLGDAPRAGAGTGSSLTGLPRVCSALGPRRKPQPGGPALQRARGRGPGQAGSRVPHGPGETALLTQEATQPHHVGGDLIGCVPIQVKLECHHLVVVCLQLALHHLVARVAHLRDTQVVRPGAGRVRGALRLRALPAGPLTFRMVSRGRLALSWRERARVDRR